MKCHVKCIIALSLCVGYALYGMDGDKNKHIKDNPYVTIPVIPISASQVTDTLARALDDQVSAGYADLGNALDVLDKRVRANPVLFQGPIKMQYDKYHKKYTTKHVDKNNERYSGLYFEWANKVRAINAASYGTLFVKAYPKRLAVTVTLLVAAGLAASGYFGYAAYQYYMQQQKATEQNAADTNEAPTEPPAQPINHSEVS